MNRTTRSARELSSSTSQFGSLGYLNGGSADVCSAPNPLNIVIDLCGTPSKAVDTRADQASQPSSKRLTRLEARALKEASDPHARESARAARRQLAEEFSAIAPNSLAVARLQQGLSQTQLAEVLKTSQSHIAKIEAGKVSLYFSTAAKLADALSMSLDQLRTVIAVEDTKVMKVEPAAE